MLDLSGCQAKIDRAREHMVTLGEETTTPQGMDSGRRLGVEVSFDPIEGDYVCTVAHIPEGWLRRIATMTGDVVHNLRSALDHLAWQLVLDDSGSPTEEEATKIQFPIARKRKAFFKKLAVQQMSAHHRDLVLRFQPCEDPGSATDHPLTVLRNLSNHDKHRLLTPILVRGAGYSYHPVDEDLRGLPIHLYGGSDSEELEIGTELTRIGMIPAGMERQIERASGVIPGLWLEQTNKSLEDELEKLAVFVQNVVDGF